MPALIEIESVISQILARGESFPAEPARLTVYVVASGGWTLQISEPTAGENPELVQPLKHSLHPGDVALLTLACDHALECADLLSEDIHSLLAPVSSAVSQCLRLSLVLREDDAARFRALPTVVTAHSLLLFSGLLSAMNDDSTQLQMLASVLTGVVLAGRPDLLLSKSSSRLDPEVTQTMAAMEREPGKPWTIERLADEVGISRSALAQKFKEQVGQTLSEYLLNIRMRIAHDLLRDRRHHLKEIARLTGYQSVSAFSTAFKRWSGQPPSAFRKSSTSRHST